MRLLNKIRRTVRRMFSPLHERKRFYLAHPFDSRHELREWELEVEKSTGLEIVNPFYDIDRGTDISDVDEGRSVRYSSGKHKAIVTRDVKAIRKTDGVIAFVTGDLSYGTIQELVYAYLDSAPVYLVCTNGHEEHPWLVYHTTKIFTSREELEEFLVFHIM